MNSQERMFFHALTRDRAESADMLEKPSMRGIKNSVVEKYSDQAHFIYELLQNADDAHASRARFILETNRLIFAHNGTRHFSVSDPANEDQDAQNGKLGDINAITSIANSNKTEASIGKFGVGFKAVFQYTSTPHIYGPKFKFKIERFIVPSLLDNDFPGRKEDETLFVFPFDHTDRTASEAFEDISTKLKSLSFPLLFLSELKDIDFEIGERIGLYGKTVTETYDYGDTTAELVCLTQNDGNELYDENLWLFSRLDDHRRRYSVGFFMDSDGHLRPSNEPAFCFFPTKEVTGLNFIVHAPFLLTDSREGIRAGIAHNDRMIQCLADLAAQAFLHLRDIGQNRPVRLIEDNVVTIIPVDSEKFSDPADKRKVSFLPFFNSIRNIFEQEALLPTSDGYTEKNNAYWAAVTQLPKLFSNEQLGEICKNSNARWVFIDLGRDEVQRNNKALFLYLDALTRTNLNEDALISGRSRSYYYNRIFGERLTLETVQGITGEFIEKQSIDWLHEFYKWLSETKHRTDSVLKKPIFLDQDKKAAAAFDKDGQLVLFLPVPDISGYSVIHSSLLENQETRQFIETLGIKPPSLKDQIYNIILPQYKQGGEIDTDPHFQLFFNYYCSCSHGEVEKFVKLIKDYEFLTYYIPGESNPHRGKASELYLPSPELLSYFETSSSARFIALDEYREMVGLSREVQLMSFLNDIGINKEVRVISSPVDYHSSNRTDLPYYHSTRGRSWDENILDGCAEIVEHIVNNNDKEKSILLWKRLLCIIESKCISWRCSTLSELLVGTYKYHYYEWKTASFDSSDAILLKNSPWMMNAEGVFVLPGSIARASLPDIYPTKSEASERLLDFLGVLDKVAVQEEVEDTSNLTDDQKEKIEFANKLKELGFNESDLEDLKEFKRQRDAKRKKKDTLSENSGETRASDNNNNATDSFYDDFDDVFESSDDIGTDDHIAGAPSISEKAKRTRDVVKDLAHRVIRNTSDTVSIEYEEDDPFDYDEMIPSAVDYSKQIERAKQKSIAEINKIANFEELQTRAMNAEKYSFNWFCALLEMEAFGSGAKNTNSKEISISFAKVEREPGTKRTLVLKHPNRYIPHFMEELADIPLVLHMGDQSKTVAIEVANINSYTLRVKLKNGAQIDDIDLHTVTAATIDAKSPVFLLNELQKKFTALDYDGEYNLRDNLCENIEFIFGPPGTGKTTYLARNVLAPLMASESDCKVLVLTPTNKASDVLTRRIMEIAGEDKSFEDWLVRFGTTGDEDIENSPVFKDKTFDIRTLRKNVTITTIARFPYDFFMPQSTRVFLDAINWDYIVIDEASMIPLVNIVYPLYKKTPQKFYIAGDPFQIEPITSASLWKNENIYTMVGLDSFVTPQTVPHQYKVTLLTTQYRSIPSIGSIFSSFSYGGILKHYRNIETQKPLNLGLELDLKTLNLIKFPISRYESIYRSKKLQHSSSYQVYSALFTFEFVSYISRHYALQNTSSTLKIGIIAPYRAQADMIDKLLASEEIPSCVDVQVGTIHGFQGDECDIIFAVFNTPPTISESKEMFLNKRNIVNVSISRARDYLFVVMPDDQTDNIEKLHLIKRVERLMKQSDCWAEFHTNDLEEVMFGESSYLENNAFSTTHQSVNVYGLPEKRYEIRTEEAAVDVQIHRSIPAGVTAKEHSELVAEQHNASRSFEYTDKVKTPVQNSITQQERIIDTVPKSLQGSAFLVSVSGALHGSFYMVPYKGKLKEYTRKKATLMYIPLVRFEKERLVPITVVVEDRILYIAHDSFIQYKKELVNSNIITVRANISQDNSTHQESPLLL